MVPLSFGALTLLDATNAGAATGPDPQGTIYVATTTGNAVDVFAPGSTGNAAPERRIQGATTGLSEPVDVQVSATGDLYVSNLNVSSITEYAPQATGNAVPICTIQGTLTRLDFPDDISLEADGTLVVGDFYSTTGSGAVEAFAPGACGNVAPEAYIQGTTTTLTLVDGAGTDAFGNMFVANTYHSTIDVFTPAANGNVAPVSAIAGTTTGLGWPDDVVVGFNGQVYVTSGFGGPLYSVEEFAAGASGNATPLIDIHGPTADLTTYPGPDDLAVDATGNIYVTTGDAASVLIWGAGKTGNVGPTAVISGPTTTFAVPEGVAIAGPPSTISATVTTHDSSASITAGGSVSDTAKITPGTVAPTGTLVFKLFGPGDTTCVGTPVYTSTSPVAVTGGGTYSSGLVTLTTVGTYYWQALYSGDPHNAPVTTPCGATTETVTVSAAPSTVTTALTVSPATGDYHDPTTVSATLTTAATGNPVTGASVTLTLDGTETCTATTDATGVATCSITPGESAGTYALVATFAGGTGYAPSTGSAVFTVTHEQTGLSYTGTTSAVDGQGMTLSGTLTTDDPGAGTPLPGESVTLTLGTGTGAQSCSATTASTGLASCTITSVDQPVGTAPVSASFAGDTWYVPATARSTVSVFAPTAVGAFVIGDGSARHTSATQYFWGSKWAKKNSLSGGHAPPSMKGFADSPTSMTCGSTWTTRTGNASMPPAALPPVIDVIVASTVTKSGPVIRGTIAHIVEVAVDPGYGPAPGHTGTGTIVGMVC